MIFSGLRTPRVSPFPLAAGAGFLPMPIIVGCPRSGTTLLRFMLDAHPQLAIPPETGFLELGPKFRGRGDKLRQKFFCSITNFPSKSPNWPDFEIGVESFRSRLAQIEPFSAAAGYRAFYALYAARFGKSRWGDKTPLYCLQLNTIRQVLPEARFIHIIRDGRDAALSLQRMWFSPGGDIETQAAYWRKCVRAARLAGAGHNDYLEVRYEDLIMNTTATLKKICSFIKLEYDPRMLTYYQHTPERLKEHKGRYLKDGKEIKHDERIRQQQRTMQPPDPTCVFAWKSAMRAAEAARFKAVAGDLLSELGYEL